MSSPVIEVRDLTVEYGSTAAVAGTSFDVQQGEVFALLGTNGAGKTTTLDVLEGYREATHGHVSVYGMDPVKDRDRLAPRLGIMLQEAGFFETLSVAQTVKAWRKYYRAPRALADALEMVGLAHKADTRVGQLSGGERRRLDLALALLGHPDLLFLDEPTTGMDPEGRRASLDLVGGLVREGMTVVLTTHYLEEAEQLADRVAIMHRGTIKRMGSVAEVVAGAGVTRVRFTVSAEVARAIPAPLRPALTDKGDRVAVEVRSSDPQLALGRLLHWADESGVTLDELEVRRGSLEDVFLGLADQSADVPVPRLVPVGA